MKMKSSNSPTMKMHANKGKTKPTGNSKKKNIPDKRFGFNYGKKKPY